MEDYLKDAIGDEKAYKNRFELYGPVKSWLQNSLDSFSSCTIKLPGNWKEMLAFNTIKEWP